ncbi:MAG: thermonuclease family protein [Planctomycetes bacterium]|nr:thermonuclease family protein [Planctomycetota bacterium]MCW8135614.1 thermonuclease family protein [Planctomycetota bacterium]
MIGVRLIGVNTPERGQAGWAEARDFLRALLTGQRVRLAREAGHANRDRYGRLLRLVYLDDDLVQALIIAAGHSEYTARWGRSPTIEAACDQ